jgi:hypothetical protein
MRGENDADCGEEQQDQDEQSTEEDGCAVTFSKMQVLVRIRPLLPGDGTEEEPQVGIPVAVCRRKEIVLRRLSGYVPLADKKKASTISCR